MHQPGQQAGPARVWWEGMVPGGPVEPTTQGRKCSGRADSGATCFWAIRVCFSLIMKVPHLKGDDGVRNGCHLTGGGPASKLFVTAHHRRNAVRTPRRGHRPHPGAHAPAVFPPSHLHRSLMPPPHSCTFSFLIPENPPCSSAVEIPLTPEAAAQTLSPVRSQR